MTEKPNLKLNSEDSVTIDGIALDDLVQPVDFSGVATAGTPTRIQIGKPKRDEWVTVRPEDNWHLAAYTIEEAETMDREQYIVVPELANGLLCDDARYTNLFLTISSTGRLFFWAVKQSAGSRRNFWAESAKAAVEIAKRKWIRLIPGHDGYEIREATVQMPEAQWPSLSRDELIRLAFEDRIIKSDEHPVARRLTRGG